LMVQSLLWVCNTEEKNTLSDISNLIPICAADQRPVDQNSCFPFGWRPVNRRDFK